MSSALEDVRVLEIGGEFGAWCGKLLADMGAEVIKVEPPAGDATRGYAPFYQDRPGKDRSLYFWHYNTSKKSVTLDLATERGKGLFMRAAASTDVVIDSSPPGHLDSLGIGYERLREVVPDIVMAAISPFGQDAPYRDFVATDLTTLAFGGPVWSCGYDDHSIAPVRGGGNQGYQTACHFAVIGIMTALVHRQLTGVGQFVDVNMHAAQNVSTEGAAHNWLTARNTVQRQTGRHAAVNPSSPTQVMCRDGRYVTAGFPARTEEQWVALIAWLDEEGLVGNLANYLEMPNRQAMIRGDQEALRQVNEVMEAVRALAAKMDSYELFTRAQDLGFQWGLIYSPEEALEDRHFRERGMKVEVQHPEMGTSFAYPGAPYVFHATPWRIRRRAPLLGEDNEAVYVCELGLTREELASLRDDGVV